MRTAMIIPTLNAARHLATLLPALDRLDPAPDETLFIDSSSTDGTAEIVAARKHRVHIIRRSDFGHGRTRNLGARLVDADILVYLTQDAIPQDASIVAALTRPFADPRIAHAFGRQIPHRDATGTARFARRFNYPAASYTRSLADVPRLGIKAFFTSNSCAAYRASALRQVGGFPENTPTTEDNIATARFLRLGYSLAYAADAVVAHSHNYTIGAEFSRYFDIGVSHSLAPDLLEMSGEPNSEGLRFIREELRFLADSGRMSEIPGALVRDAAKYLGYRLGRGHARLPLAVKRRICLHSFFWNTAVSSEKGSRR
jgi:rhamnosyltransferase